MPTALRVWLARLRWLLGRSHAENAFNQELAAHLDLLTDRFLGQGMSPEQARQAARRQFGGISQLKDNLRDQASYPVIDSLVQDFALALRQIRLSPRFAISAAAILGLGIGASTAIFTVVNATFLRPLPYAGADRLVWAGEILKRNTADEITLTPNFLDWRRRNRVFTAMAAYHGVSRTLIATGEAKPVQTLKASAALLPILMVKPVIGRAFLPMEDRRGQDRVAILSYRLWQQTFGGDRSVVGRPIALDDGAYLVVGVLPRDFHFPTLESIDLMTPLGKNEELELARADGATTTVRNVIARLKPGVTLRQARAEMEAIEASLAPPAFFQGVQMSVRVMPLQERFTGNLRYALVTLLCAVGCLLLLACANVANLQLGRGESRRKEMAVRAALGASRGRIAQQLLVESLAIAALGGAIGLLIAFCGRSLLLNLIPPSVPGPLALPIDSRVLGFAVLSAFASTLLFGTGPALAGANASASSAINSGSRTLSGGTRRQRWLSGLASLQMALAIVLLSGGGLMLQSFWRLRYQDVGFNTDRVLAARIVLNRARYADASRQILFLNAVIEKLKNIPGVEGVGLGPLPPGEGHATNGFAIEGRPLPPQGRRPVAREYPASPGLFRMLGVPVSTGREMEESDTATTMPVAVVNEAFARTNFPAGNPLGQRVRSDPDKPWRTIVGVVANMKTAGLANSTEPAIFLPYRQAGFAGGDGAGFLIRTAGDVASLAPEIRRQVAQADPRQPVLDIRTIEQRLDDSAARPRLAAVLLASFAALGLVLAAAGLHSVMFVLVRSRFREIGIRRALGGEPRNMVWMILSHSLRVMAVGLVLGLGCAIWLSRILRNMWYGVSAADLLTLAGSSLLLISAGLAASWLPARQASRVDPMEILRGE